MSRNSWYNFLENEKLTEERAGAFWPHLECLAEACLTAFGQPKIAMHSLKIESRRNLVNMAFQMGLDLAAIKCRGKTAMGRGLLDVWNAEYTKKYGSNVGTSGVKESSRRNIKTLLSKKPRHIPNPG